MVDHQGKLRERSRSGFGGLWIRVGLVYYDLWRLPMVVMLLSPSVFVLADLMAMLSAVTCLCRLRR